MTSNTLTTDGFILSEAPSVKSKCIVCDKPIKHSLTETDQGVVLEINYRPKTIIIYPGGRCFEQVDRSFIHVCPQAEASESNSLRSVTRPELALL